MIVVSRTFPVVPRLRFGSWEWERDGMVLEAISYEQSELRRLYFFCDPPGRLQKLF